MRDEDEQRRFGSEPDEHEDARRWEGRSGQRDLDEPGPRGEYGDHDGAQQQQQQGGLRGTGPKGYARTDEAILEDVCEELQDADVDASEVSVAVENGDVTLSGRVDSRWAKRCAEDVSYSARGVRDVRNQLEVDTSGVQQRRATATAAAGHRR